MDKEMERLLELWGLPLTKDSRNEAFELCKNYGRRFIDESYANDKIHPEINDIIMSASPRVLTVMVISMMCLTMED